MISQLVKRSLGKLVPETSALFLCDLQEKYRDMNQHFDGIVQASSRLTNAAAMLNIPVIVSEQETSDQQEHVKELGLDRVVYKEIHGKTAFSMCTPAVLEFLGIHNIQSVILCGVSAHICVLQTCLDLLEQNVDVHIVVDAISAKHEVDRMYAYRRMEQAGAFLTTYESIIFLLIKNSKHPNYEALVALVEQPTLDTGLSCCCKKA